MEEEKKKRETDGWKEKIKKTNGRNENGRK